MLYSCIKKNITILGTVIDTSLQEGPKPHKIILSIFLKK